MLLSKTKQQEADEREHEIKTWTGRNQQACQTWQTRGASDTRYWVSTQALVWFYSSLTRNRSSTEQHLRRNIHKLEKSPSLPPPTHREYCDLISPFSFLRKYLTAAKEKEFSNHHNTQGLTITHTIMVPTNSHKYIKISLHIQWTPTCFGQPRGL